MRERLAKLIDVKSIVTIVMTAALVALLFTGVEPAKELLALYCTSYGAIVAYFFSKKDSGASPPPSGPAGDRPAGDGDKGGQA